jgi:vitamin B12 transporter
MWNTNTIMVFILCFQLLIISPLFAQEPDAETEPYLLGEIIVSAKRKTTESVTAVHRVTALEIKNSGARTLDEAISLIPGINIRIGGKGTPRIDIRGFRTRHVQLFLDGIPMNDTYDGQFDPTSIPVEHIAEIKVLTGVSSVLYGPGGNGGVINIITKKGKKGIHGSVGAELGEGDAETYTGTLSGGMGEADFFASARAKSRNSFPLSDDFKATAEEDGGARENSDHKRNNQFASFGYAPGEKTKFGLLVNTVQGENGVPPRTFYDAADPFSKKIKYDRIDDINGLSAHAAFNHKTALPLELSGYAYVNTLDEEENRYDDSTYATQANNGAYLKDTTSRIFGASLRACFDLDTKGNMTLGLTQEKHKWNEDGWNIDKTGTNLVDNDNSITIKSIALEYEIEPFDRLDLLFGYGYHFMDGDDIDDKDAGALAAGAHYALTDSTNIRGSYTEKIRFPSIQQLYDSASGNLNLSKEKSKQFEMGVTQRIFSTTSATLTLFRTNAKYLIEKDSSDIYQNQDKYRMKGCEISVEDHSVENLLIRAAYTYLDAKDKSSGSDFEELEHRPQNTYSLAATYSFPFGLRLHASLLRVTDQYFYDEDGTPPLEKKKLNDYTLVNAKAGMTLLKGSADIYVKVENLFDEDYEQSYCLPQAGRVIYGGVEFKF